MKFTIRDLLWLTVVVALGVGWWVEHRHMAIREGNAKARIGRIFKPDDAEQFFWDRSILFDEEQDRNQHWKPVTWDEARGRN